MDTLFTPKQIAGALGVSESTIKRWVDNGRIRAGKTVGGHRKLTLAAIVEFIRETGHEAPHPEKIGLAACTTRRAPEQLAEPLYEALVSGDEPGVRNLVLGLYQNGESIVRIGDQLLSPVFRRIGQGWESGELSVHQERRSCTALLAVLYEIRLLAPTPGDDAPLVLCATPHTDFAEVPIRLVELTARHAGRRTWMAGAGLPLQEIQGAIRLQRPQLVCVSVTHTPDREAFAREFNESIAETCDGMAQLVVGGSAIETHGDQLLRCDQVCRSLADLERYLGSLAE